MNIFRPSDEELRNREEKLRKDTAELEKRQAELVSQEEVLNHEKQILATGQDQLSVERKKLEEESEKLESRRQEVLRLEAAAKANFTETQRKTFEEVIQSRLDKCAARENELAEYQSQLAVREEAVSKREGDVSARDLDVTRREQNADAGFADKARALSDETRRKEQAVAEESERLKRLADDLAERSRALDARAADLDARENAVRDAESKRDTGFSTERASFLAQIEALRLENRANEETAIAGLRAKLHAKLDEDLASERASRIEALETELSARREAVKNREKELDGRDARLKEEEAKAADERRALEAEKEALAQDRKRLEGDDERRTVRAEQRTAKLDEEVEARVAEQCAAERTEIGVLRQTVADLKKKLEDSRIAYEQFDAFRRKFGARSPEQTIEALDAATADLQKVREELAIRPTRESFDRLKEELALLKEVSKSREDAWEESEKLQRDISRLEAEKAEAILSYTKMQGRAESAENLADKYRTDLGRLTASYAEEVELDVRIAAVRDPVIKNVSQPTDEGLLSEIDWLDGIGRACDDYGIHFPKRILYAYHTALKTAEMSPLVVLAGVSGTGKSELPRLYSHFGGLLFEPVSVQPNWDSQESMLGFFNSIDNRFEAQRLLRFLAQSQTEWSKGYPGLKERMCMVLLDEMNLAHPELYFAEFLSKFETRRGKGPDEVPSLEVKLGTGAGMRYPLPLGRNVLWSGTMNQDETTKSLSDKVLDRAIVINFPRPNRLIRRTKLMRLEDFQPGVSMTWKTWRSWLHKGESAFLNHEQLILPYQKFLEDLNQHLGEAGRAIGHRVWQSVESYMSAYPGMREAIDDKAVCDKLMHVAFEDQLVQKVMPKLRGIDTRGNSRKKCLDPIRSALLEGVGGMTFESLNEDFDLACELGYGQFMWQSANYIVDEAEQPTSTSEMTDTGTTE